MEAITARHGGYDDGMIEVFDEICYYLIKDQKADLEVTDDYLTTALIHAADYNRNEVLRVLIDNNANIKAQNVFGNHAAYCAAFYGNLDTLEMMVTKDRSVIDLKGWQCQTPLIISSYLSYGHPSNGNPQIVKFLVDQKANVNLKDDYGKTALQQASNPEIIKILNKVSQV